MKQRTKEGRLDGSRRTGGGKPRACVVVGALLGTAMLQPAPELRADPVTVLNAVRMAGCGDQPASGTPVQPDPVLDDVARELSRNDGLKDALERVGYLAASSTSFHVRGSAEDDVIRRLLAARYCAAINDPRYDEAGIFQSGGETWIVLAVRQSAVPPLEPSAVAQRVLELVNAARAEARKCGRDQYNAVHPLTLSAMLNEAALSHSRDMAGRGSLGHRGSDGSLAGERITRSGYAWRASGENVAAGQRDADAVVAAWLASPGHCATLMGSHFSEMGVAFALARSKDPAIYWTQVFAAP
jgi:uncharacterized protein YkwD